MRGFLLVTVCGALLLAASVCWSGIPHLIHYQGMLTDDGGTPLNTPQDISFRIYNDSTGGTLKWTETQYGIMMTDRLFNVNLGDSTPVDLAFDEDYWLEIDVGPGEILTPRVQLTSVGYAYRAERTDTASYALAGGEGDNDWILRITDTADTTLITGGRWGIARAGNVLIGSNDSTHVNIGVACTTAESYATVGGGEYNTASGVSATVGGGGTNTASGGSATVGGGYTNTAAGDYSTVPGGGWNTASGIYSFAAGCRAKADHDGAFVWGDATWANFASTDTNQFLIRASGGVGIGTNDPQGALDVSSTTGAFIVPRMTTAQRNTLTPVNGMIIYNTSQAAFNFYENGSWVTK